MGPALRTRAAASGLGLAATFLILLGVGPGGPRADAYFLYDNGAGDFIVGSARAIRWSPAAWGPGATLAWEIEESETWALLPGISGSSDIGPFVRRALAAWSGVPTADISWRLAGTVTPSGESRFGDSRNRVFFDPEGASGAVAWWVRDDARSVWEISECDVGIPSWLLDWDEDRLVADGLPGALVLEFGHCLGLGPAPAFPGSSLLRTAAGDCCVRGSGEGVWGPRPAMDFNPGQLSPDDRVGASLLRPRSGWLAGTGSVAGVLELAGEPVPYGRVAALRRGGDGSLHDPVSVFANADGEFLIEGLPPGDYALWAHPLRLPDRHQPLVAAGALTDWKDSILAHPVRMEAGGSVDGLVFSLREGRQ